MIPFLNLSAAPVQVSSVFNATFPGAGAFDWLRCSRTEHGSSGRATVGSPHWIYVDLGQDVQLKRVWLDWETVPAVPLRCGFVLPPKVFPATRMIGTRWRACTVIPRRRKGSMGRM